MTEPVIRLFVSSSADVSAERQRVAMAVERPNGEFAGRVRIELILWEEHFYSSHAGFQDQIAKAAHGLAASEIDRRIVFFGHDRLRAGLDRLRRAETTPPPLHRARRQADDIN